MKKQKIPTFASHMGAAILHNQPQTSVFVWFTWSLTASLTVFPFHGNRLFEICPVINRKRGSYWKFRL